VPARDRIEPVVPSPVDSHDDVGMAVQYGEAEYIESVLAVYPPAWPEEIQIVINGFLPDGCTEIYSMKHVRHENEYTVKIYTKKEVGVECTTALEPFEKMITLDTSELISGNYSVVVYGISINFSLEISADSIDTGG
jgi:inhibitor of cysteine peptidase